MGNPNAAMLAASLAAMAFLPGSPFDLPDFKPKRKYLSRTSCIKCDAKIPPGRPGRKCEACRQ